MSSAPPYLDVFGLSQAPFAAGSEGDFFFKDAQLTQRFEMLQHLTRYSDLLLMVIGEQGSGKTTLRQHFLSTNPDMHVCQVDVGDGMDAADLMYQIAEGFGLQNPDAGYEELVQGLQMSARGKESMLIIDDAHRLPADALKVILDLAEVSGDEGKLLRIVLFCEPSIDDVLADPAIATLRDRVTHTLEVPLLSEEQTAAYLLHRMNAAGFEGDNPFSPKLLKKIFKGSGGSPARINELAHQALSELTGKDGGGALGTMAGKTNKWVIIGMAAGVVMIVAGVLLFLPDLFKDTDEVPQEEEVVVTDDGRKTLILALPDGEVTVELGDEEAPQSSSAAEPKPRLKGWPTEPVAEPTTGEEETVTHDHDPTVAPNAIVDAEEPSAVVQTPQALAPVISEVNPQEVMASDAPQQITLTGSGFGTDNKVTLGWTGQTQELSAEQVKVESPERMMITVNTGQDADTWTVRVTDFSGRSSNTASFRVTEPPQKTQKVVLEEPKSAPQPAAPKTTTQKKSGDVQRENWLQVQNPRHYTIQILGTKREPAVGRYISRHKLQGDMAYFHTTHQGGDWYSLVYGVYDNRQQAVAAANELKPKLGGTQPWVRSFADIQSQLKETVSSPAPTPTVVKTAAQTGDAWLWSQDPRHYTLQLLAGSKESTVKNFIRNNGLKNEATYYRTVRNGEDWFVLVYGSYANQEQATAAKAKLPAAVRKQGPWSRSFASVHDELSKAGSRQR